MIWWTGAAQRSHFYCGFSKDYKIWFADISPSDSPDILELPGDGWAHICESCCSLQTRLRQSFRSPPIAETEREKEEWWAAKKKKKKGYECDEKRLKDQSRKRHVKVRSKLQCLFHFKEKPESIRMLLISFNVNPIEPFQTGHRQPVRSTDSFLVQRKKSVFSTALTVIRIFRAIRENVQGWCIRKLSIRTGKGQKCYKKSLANAFSRLTWRHREKRAAQYLRSGGSDLLPGFGDVLFQLIKRSDAQLPLNFSQLLVFGCQHLGQSLDLIFDLHTHAHRRHIWFYI